MPTIKAKSENVLKGKRAICGLFAFDKMLECIRVLRCATVVEDGAASIEKYQVRNRLDLVLLNQIFLLVKVDLLEGDVSEFWFCCVKHGRK